MLSFDGAVDPVSVHDGSVTVTAADGVPLDAVVGVEGGQLVVRPVATPDLRSHAPAGFTVRIAGAPSPGALRMTDGRLLSRAASVDVRLQPVLADDDGATPRLVGVQGGAPTASVVLPADGRLTLTFDGVLDTESLTPRQCALQPLVGGLVLDRSVEPQVAWRCVGRRFELLLQLAPADGPLQFSLRRAGLRGLSGSAAEPPLVIEVRPAG